MYAKDCTSIGIVVQSLAQLCRDDARCLRKLIAVNVWVAVSQFQYFGVTCDDTIQTSTLV
jgi:hypothetical protein